MRSLQLLTSELWFDPWFGTETRAVLEGDQLGDLAGGPDRHPPIYHAVNPLVFAHALKQVRTLAPDASRQGAFVDFGSGKGRALILAAGAGFQRVVGIEYSSVLHACCRQNLDRAWRRRAFSGAYQLHLGNAAQFAVPDDSVVWFWFNPFDSTSARQVATNLLASLRRRPRPAYLIYARPVHVSPLLALGFRVAAEVRLAPDHIDALVLQYQSDTPPDLFMPQ